MWETASVNFPADQIPEDLMNICNCVVLGDCVVLPPRFVYATKRKCWCDDWTVVGRNEIIALTNTSIYSLKLKLRVQPPKATVPHATQALWESLLFSSDSSDVTFVCPDGTEIPAHRVILATGNPYFRTYFSGLWTEQYPDGRWETEKSSNVIKSLLSLIYTGKAPFDLSDAQLLELFETVYEFQFNDDLCRVCQAKCIENINHANVKDLLLSSKTRNASFLFDVCFEYVCSNFVKVCKDCTIARGIMDFGEGELWNEIVQSSRR